MAEGPFARLREYADDVARQPDFDTIRARAVRVRKRRRNTASSVVAGVTAVVVAAFAVSTGPREHADPVAGPSSGPSASASWGEIGPHWTTVEAAGPNELYAVFVRCRACVDELHFSDDAGRTWQRRNIPPLTVDGIESRFSSLVVVGSGGVLLWTEYVPVDFRDLVSPTPGGTSNSNRPHAIDTSWISLDGGRTWQRPADGGQPVDAVPAGTRPVDCGLIRRETPCRLYAVDPASGRFSPLAGQPTGITYVAGWAGYQTDVPIGGQLWVSGLDPTTRKPAVAASTDGGRTWNTHVFTGGIPAEDGPLDSVATMYLPTVAAGTGGTAYTLLYHAEARADPYRTTDGGRTWQAVPGGAVPEVPDAGYLTADGAHVIKNGNDFKASRNGGPYEPVTLAGYPDELRRLTQVTSQNAAGRYLVTSGDVLYTSDDGWTWRQVTMP